MKIAEAKLSEAKNKLKLIAFDYDGTIHGSEYSHERATELMRNVIKAGKYMAVITARAATALRMIYPGLRDFYEKENVSIPCFIAGGNGTVLYEIKKGELNKIYSHGLNEDDFQKSISAWQKVYSDLGIKKEDINTKGIDTFKSFLQDDWSDYIPSNVVNFCRAYDGQFFTEEAKMTFVLPADISRNQQIIDKVQLELGKDYSVKAGDTIFCHITKSLDEDGKAVAVKSILELMNLKEDKVVTFGDMPHGNDAGLLSFPYSFTNFNLNESDVEQPPYYLPEADSNKVGSVHNAIKFLIN